MILKVVVNGHYHVFFLCLFVIIDVFIYLLSKYFHYSLTKDYDTYTKKKKI